MSNDAMPPPPRGRGRLVLIVLVVLFFGSAIVAMGLRLSGWQPTANRNHGQLLAPAVDARALAPLQLDGSRLDWQPARRMWRIVVPAEPQCGSACVDLSHNLHKVWQLLGHSADNVEILWLGALPPDAAAITAAPSPELRAALPGAVDTTGSSVYVVDPNGFVVLRYAPGFDPAGLRADLAKLLKLK